MRVIETEWLDTLPPSDPRAQRSRADLRRINLVMGNARILAGALAPHWRPGMRIADLGAGDGDLAVSLAARLPEGNAVLVDRMLFEPPEKLAKLGWRARVAQSDVLDFLRYPGPRFDAIICNLFLHHLDGDALVDVLALAAERTSLFVACEPRRSLAGLRAAEMLWALWCNDVTRHDAAASVRAGFAGRDLSNAWPSESGWRLTERAAAPFSHLFIAHAK